MMTHNEKGVALNVRSTTKEKKEEKYGQFF